MNKVFKKIMASMVAITMLVAFMPQVSFADTSETVSSANISVSLEIKGDADMGGIYNETIEIAEGENVFNLLKQVAADNDIPLEYHEEWKYVTSMNGLAAGEKGPNSGWLYKVNGESPNVGAGDYVLADGDKVLFYFTLDFEAEYEDEPEAEIEDDKASTGDEPLTDMETISASIDKIVELYKSKKALSGWEALVLALMGNDIEVPKGETRLPTDRAKRVLLLQIAGIDATNIGGVNLLEQIYNADDMGKQGLNGYIFSLLAMSNAVIPETAKISTDQVVEIILDGQNEDGGFPITVGKNSDYDMTAMAITSLSPYYEKAEVKIAMDRAIDYLMKKQEDDGTYLVWDAKSSEIISQIIIALASNGINPDVENFKKNNRTLMDVLLDYQKDDGTFSNIKDGKSNNIATEQAAQALISYKRYFDQEKAIYLATKDPVVIKPEKDFLDKDQISDWALESVNKAIELGIVGGDDKGRINPKNNVTRAEFINLLLATMGTKADTTLTGMFTDVKEDAWYTQPVETAAKLGLIKGTASGVFSPNATISRQDMAVILARAYNLVGEAPGLYDAELISPYAKQAVEAVISNGVMTGVSYNKFDPRGTVTREMAIAVMIRLVDNM